MEPYILIYIYIYIIYKGLGFRVIHTYIYIYIYRYIDIYFLYIYTYTHTYIRICIWYECVYVCMYACMHVFIHTHTHTHTHTNMYTMIIFITLYTYTCINHVCTYYNYTQQSQLLFYIHTHRNIMYTRIVIIACVSVCITGALYMDPRVRREALGPYPGISLQNGDKNPKTKP